MNLILNHKRAGYPALAIETAEESRTIAQICDSNAFPFVWAVGAAGGLIDAKRGAMIEERATAATAFAKLTQERNTLLVVTDWHHICKNAAAYRPFLNSLGPNKANGNCIVFLAPSWDLPRELVNIVPVLRDSLPSVHELGVALDSVLAAAADSPECDREAVLTSCRGLTLEQAENALALSLVDSDMARICPDTVNEEKMRLVRSSGKLEVYGPTDPETIGGLGRLKRFLSEEVVPNASDLELAVRGILLAGLPGTGKSLSAKACGALLGCPVLRMDLASLRGSLVGQSESNLREALRIAEAISPCVLWMDELEKAVSGSSGARDGGTSSGMLGILLTWLQEHRSPIFVIGTCNDYDQLPSAITRSGRFDERFFVDIPTRGERIRIAQVHLRRFGMNDADAEPIADATNEYTGAEIEALVKALARRHDRRIPSAAAIASACEDIRPIMRSNAEEMQRVREWGRGNLRLANDPDESASGRVIA